MGYVLPSHYPMYIGTTIEFVELIQKIPGILADPYQPPASILDPEILVTFSRL